MSISPSNILATQVLYDFVEWEQISVFGIQGVLFTVKRHRKLQEAQVDLETQNISGAQRAQRKSNSSFHTHCFSIYLKNQMAKTVTCSSSYRDPLCWETQYIKETQKTCWTVRPMIHLWDPWDLTLPTNILPHRERVLKWQSWLYCVCGREGYHHWVLSLWRKIVPPLCHFVDNALRYITTTAVTFLHIEFYVLGLFTLKFHLGMGCQTRCSQNADIGIKGVLPNQMISLILIFGCLCSSIQRRNSLS